MTAKKGALDYTKVLDDRPYFDPPVSGPTDTMAASLSTLAAAALPNLPADERERFRSRIESYQSIQDLPTDLMLVLQTYS